MYSTSFLVNYLHLFPVPEHFIFNCLSQRRSCNLLQCSYLFYYENNILQRLKEKVVLLIAYASVKKKKSKSNCQILVLAGYTLKQQQLESAKKIQFGESLVLW